MVRSVVAAALGGAWMLLGACAAPDDGVVDAGGVGTADAGGGAGPPPPPAPLDPTQVRLGTAVAATADAPRPAPAEMPAPPEGVVMVDLGPVVVGEDGASGTILVDVDLRIRGLTVVVLGQPDAQVMLTRAEAPDGSVIVDDAPVAVDVPARAQATTLSRGFPAQFLSPGRVLPARRIGAFPVPSTADLPLAKGTWALRVGHFTLTWDEAQRPTPTPLPLPVRVWVLVRTVAPGPGGVGLALHFTGAGGLTADAAARSPAFQDALALTRDVYGGVGVDLDDVVYGDVADGAALRTLVLDEPTCDGGDLDEIVARGRPDRLNVFFVDRFECGSVGPFLLGLSPGVPGVPWASATPSAGVVVAGAWLTNDPDRFAVTLAHEIGHWLGLFHTQENDRFGAALYDNVADTGEAPAARENLMFFDVSRIRDRALSAGQAATLQRGAVVLP
ncbi:MAG: hypothetical protein FJ137_07390 [Deltaproteobacteria bacterium]|nr:hypothetical protein [Deltaproteobacteria bacterium]